MPLGFGNSIFAQQVAEAGVTDPTGGVQFQRSVSERINLTSLGSLPTDQHIYHGSCWFKLDSHPTGTDNFCIAASSNTSDGNFNFYLMYLNNNGSPYLRVNGHTRLTNTFFTYNVTLNTGQWYHVIWKNAVDGTTNRELWLDGTQVVDTGSTSTNPFPMDGSNGLGAQEQMCIGALTNTNTTFFHHWDGCLEQYYWNAGDIDISANLDKFYDNGFVDMGTDGTGSGLSQPTYFHQGNNQATFDNLGGTATATVTVNGTLAACS